MFDATRGTSATSDLAADPVTSLPTRAIYSVAFGSPVLAFLGAFLGHALARRTAAELEIRSQREETMRTLRWAADLGVSGDEAAAAVGLRILEALGESDLLQSEQQAFIDATLAAILKPVETTYSAGDDVTVEVRGDESVDG